MYKQITLPDLKRILNLPEDYKVDACVVYGGFRSIYKRKFLSIIKESYKVEKLKNEFIKPILSVKVGNKRIWFVIEYGGARLSEFVHFASMLGSKINLLMGSCGALKKGIDPLSILVPTYSYSTESSCHMYLRDNTSSKFYADEELSKEAASILQKTTRVCTGPTITCQAMMAETWKDVCDWSARGFYGVEMEASTVFAVSQHFKIPTAAILNIGDNLIEKEIVDSESYRARTKQRKKIKNEIFKVGVNLALKYAKCKQD